LRPTAYKYKSQKAEKFGQYFYNIGLSLPLAMISSAKSSFKNHSAKEFFITIKSFLKQKDQRNLSHRRNPIYPKSTLERIFQKFGL
jgi:hypothetical protein